MEIKYFLFKLIFFLFNANFALSNEINNNKNINGKSSLIENDHSQRKLADEFQPIRIFYDKTAIEKFAVGQPEFRKSIVYEAFDNCINALKKIIQVKPYNEPIKYDFSNHPVFNESYNNINPKLLSGIEDCDLVVVPLLLEEYSRFEMTSHDILRNSEGRVTLAVIKISYTFDFRYRNSNKYLQYLIFHQMIHILGFSYESFERFPGGKDSTYYIESEDSSDSTKIRAYIKTPKVLAFAKKYFNCNDFKGIPLENQEEGKIKIAHWEPRLLLGDIMSSLTYTPDQVLSEFTLSLLEDSGWYKINYYTGGLMRFGKHKGCEFWTHDCSEEFENDFCPFIPGISNSCSSGRQSRTYCNPSQKFVQGYDRYPGNWVGEEYADYCIINNNHDKEAKQSETIGYFEGSCKDGSTKYGDHILYDEFKSESDRIQVGNDLGERLGLENSFCALSTVYNSKYPNFVYYVYPMCYPMYCTDSALTIQIKNQYVVCPVTGGKTAVNGDFNGYIYCPDYNLICTGTVVCNSMFDCIEKGSLSKDSTYTYNYEPNISQNSTLLLEDYEVLIGYEKNEDGRCPVECSQCKEEKKCLICRVGFNLIGHKYKDDQPIICSDLNTTEGYYLEEDGIYYECLEDCLYCKDAVYCDQCKKYRQLNDDRTVCIENVPGCDDYESDYICRKCKKGFGIIGTNRSICYRIDPKKYYTLDNIRYYPCDTNINYCDECNNKSHSCDLCKEDYYFLSDDRTSCINNLNLSLYFTIDGGISYYPCDTNISYCLECQNKADSCSKCRDPYFFIETNRTKCFSTREADLRQYYTEDNGISYYPCSGAIENCYFCNNKSFCTMCIIDYYFFKEDRKTCITGLDLTEHYSEDYGVSYYPCDTHFPNCRKCNSRDDCYLCRDNYIFVRGKRDLCFINDPDRLYNDTDGNLYPCFDNLPNCDKCFGDKYVCRNCLPNFYFVEDDRTICYNISLNEYFTENGGESYKKCSNYIGNCSECSNRTTCTRCIQGFYFVGDQKVCRNDLDLRKYYSEDDGISYWPCSIMTNCDFCSNKTVCEKCLDNYYLFRTEYDKCVTLDLRKHYKDGISYFPCSDAVSNCDECSSKGTCSKCINDYKVLYYDNTFECRRESDLINDKTVYKINDTFYAKCSESISNCDTCVNASICTRCQNDYYFINDDFTKCIHISNITQNEYYQYSPIMYYSCSFKNGIKNCKNCHKEPTDETYCDLCDNGYAIIYGNFTFCHVRSEIGVGYYTNGTGAIFYPCLKNCYECNRGDKCIQCKENFLTFAEDTVCDICTVNQKYINDDLSQNLIRQKTSEYIDNINKYSKNYSYVEQFINNNQNFTITIFRTWYCTAELLKNDYFEINNEQITNLIRTNLNSDKYYVTAHVNYQYKSYVEIYNNEENRFMNEINSICKECTEGNKIIITNNFTQELHSLGEVVTTKLFENEIDIFNKDNPVFTDICQNFTLQSIDVPLKERREIFFLGNDAKELICHDIDCNVDSIEMNNLTGICSCKMETDLSKVFLDRPKNYNNITSEEYEKFIKSDTSVNSFLIFKCAKEAFSSSIKDNACLYISIVFLVAQATIFGFYAKSKSKPKKKEEKKEEETKNEKSSKKKKKKDKKKDKKSKKDKKKKSKANPPKIGTFSITNDLEEDGDSFFEKDKPDLEKEMQEKDKEMFYNDVSGLSDEGRDDSCKDAQDKDIDSVILKEIKNEILNSGTEITDETLMTRINDYKKRRPVRISNVISSENEDEEEEEEEDDDEEGEEEEDDGEYSNTSKGINEKRIKRKKKKEKKKKSKKTKLKFLEEPSYQGDEAGVDINDKQNKKNKRKNKNKELRDSISSKDSFSVAEINKIQEDINTKTEYITFNEAIKNPSVPFADYYWKLFQLKQPFVALFSPIKFLKIEESHIPTLVKVMRIIFILSLNIFFNILHLEQKYFRKKFEYFNNKYQLRYTFLEAKISSSELFSYGFGHAYAAGLISFLICLIIQSVLNYFFFDLKKKLNMKEKNKTKKEILQFMKSTRKCFIIFFAISLGIMVIIFYGSITFAQVYRGGVLDLIAGALWTFIFLQIIPFLLCLVFALFRYYGIQKNKQILYDLSLAVFF